MSYATVEDVVNLLGRTTLDSLADRDNSGQYNVNIVTAALNWSYAIINGKIANRYTVPLTDTAGTLKQIELILTRWQLLIGSLQPSEFASFLRDAWKSDYDIAMDMLDKYSTGVQKITGETPGGIRAKMSVGLAGDDVEKRFTLTRHTVGGGDIDTNEEGTLDTV